MKSLFFICHLLVLYGIPGSLTREYIYISQLLNWTTAQTYCRQNYGDLATITTEEEQKKAVKVMGQESFLAWIGLNRTVPHVNSWQWNGGKEAIYTKWSNEEPNDYGSGENCAGMDSNGWYDMDCGNIYSFICYKKLLLVKENKTWEEALNHCRSHYTDLAFVDSETLLDLLEIETVQTQTASVWTGLRFLNKRWFWVNEMPLGSLVSLPSCPVQPYRCGAYNFNTYVWENRDCNEERNFLCYH